DGTYWLRAIADPKHFLQDSNLANNITDTKLTIFGTSVTILSQTHPDSTPPAVALTSPTPGATLIGPTTLTTTASAASGVTSVQILLDGRPLGPPLTSTPYSFTWDTSSAAFGPHLLSAQAVDTKGLIGTATPVSVTVSKQIGAIVEDQVIRVDGSTTVQSPMFSTPAAGELLLALGAADAGGQQSLTVSGAGLSWSLVKRANAQLGTAEIWKATAPAPLTNVTVTSTEASSGYSQALTVVALHGTAGIGASATAGAASGGPAVSLKTTASSSWVLGVGNDWDRAIARTLGPNQQLLGQFLDSAVGNTYWAQAINSAALSSGTTVTLNDTAPTSDRWNFAAVEVLSSGGAPPPDTTPPTVSILNPTAGQSLS